MSEECDCDVLLPGREGQHYDNCRIELMKRSDADYYRRHYPRHADGSFRLQNDNIVRNQSDVLYHLALSTDHDLPTAFGDVKFICMGGTDERMEQFASHLSSLLRLPVSPNLTAASHRYAMYKVGPVLSVSHGIGNPSMTTALQELMKLAYHAGCRDPVVMRLGTSGGLGVAPGTVVVSEYGLSGLLTRTYDLPVLGKMTSRPAILDARLADEICGAGEAGDCFRVVKGGTMTADDFYLGQGRTDGPTCRHSAEDKLTFLKRLAESGVLNIEMEATALAAITREAGLRAADVCVTLIDRLHGDQVSTPKQTLAEYQRRPMLLVGRFIKKVLDHRACNETR